MTALDASLRLGVQDAGVAVPAAVLAHRLGDDATAVVALAGAFRSAPDLVADPYWDSDPAYPPLWSLACDQAIASLESEDRSEDAHIVAVLAGLEARATALAAGIEGYRRETAQAAQLAWTGSQAGADRVVELALAHPLDTYVLDWAARVSQALGDIDEARRFRSLAVYAEGRGVAGALRIVDGTDAAVAPFGEWRFHGHYAYRRPTPWDLIIPGVPMVVVDG
jgi:hypothetical protein